MVESALALERSIAERIAAFPEVKCVVLFGSRARGDARARSDIDIAVETSGMTKACWFDLVECVEESPTLLKIDLVRLDDAPAELAAEIAREGRVVYERR